MFVSSVRVLSPGGPPRPETQQHPVHGRLRESRLDQDLRLRLREAAPRGQRPAPHPLLHRQLRGTRGKREEKPRPAGGGET